MSFAITTNNRVEDITNEIKTRDRAWLVQSGLDDLQGSGRIFFVTETGEPLITYKTLYDDDYIPPVALIGAECVRLVDLPPVQDSAGLWRDCRCPPDDEELQSYNWAFRCVRVVAPVHPDQKILKKSDN